MTVSSSNINIYNLSPNDTSDSNYVLINVATNSVAGYTVTASVGDSSNATTDLKNTANNSYTFTSLATTDNLASMSNANATSNGRWGYSFSLDNASTWSNYRGLPLYTATAATIYDTNTPLDSKLIYFKIGAKASASQVSGVYQNTINFYVVSKGGGNTGINGLVEYMQDFATLSSSQYDAVKNSMVVGEQYKLIDNRDNNTYWVAKQADGNIWMTQNLDLCIGCTGVATLTSNNTDLNVSGTAPYTTGYSTSGGVITWTPDWATSDYVISGTDTQASGFTAGGSIEGSDVYVYTSNSTANDTIYTSLSECTTAGHTEDECEHYHRGNYYSLISATAGSTSIDQTLDNSICPAGWKLPDSYGDLLLHSNIVTDISSSSYTYASNGLNNIRTNPLYLVRSGQLSGKNLGSRLGNVAFYNTNVGEWFEFNDSEIGSVTIYMPQALAYFNSVRCVARESGGSISADDINDLTYLQDFNLLSSSDKAAVKSSMASNTVYTLIDSRDSQSYQIAKLADGNIWIIDNLNLGYSTISTDLTRTNTNLNTTVTAATFNGWKKTSGSATYTNGEYISRNGTDSTSGTKYGTLYNYCSASAGTICTDSNSSDAQYDLCPAGWRMPTGENDGELYNLMMSYSNVRYNASLNNGGPAFALAGEFYSSTINSNDIGNYWSSTRTDTTSMWIWFTDGWEVDYGGANRRYGYSIRCILK
ncbi:hypothetical protein IKG33_02820 [Candidatus Saccharibacteria bacterium]|nr:hypothetical protein [Candidatus Saccharibacteria bacterium]